MNKIELLTQFIQLLPDAAMLFSNDGDVAGTNDKALALPALQRERWIFSSPPGDLSAHDESWGLLHAIKERIKSGQDCSFLWRSSSPIDGTFPNLTLLVRRVAAVDPGAFLVVFLDRSRCRKEEDQYLAAVRNTLTALQDERRRIARDLHDQIGQLLTALLFNIKSLEEQERPACSDSRYLHHMVNLADEIKEAARTLAQALHFSPLDDCGLLAVLQQYAEEWAHSTGGIVDFQCGDIAGLRLPLPTEIALFRILHQALSNAFKHSGARNVRLLLERRKHYLLGIVEDDGTIFDVESALDMSNLQNAGIAAMRELAEEAGGYFSIEAAPNEGTTVLLRIPFSGEILK